jgi:hypothetical protein
MTNWREVIDKWYLRLRKLGDICVPNIEEITPPSVYLPRCSRPEDFVKEN